MYDRVLVITINSYYSKVPSTVPRYFFSTILVPRYNFSKVPSTGTAILLSTVPTSGHVNIDLLKAHFNSFIKNYADNLISYSAKCTINKPTRYTIITRKRF